MLDLIVGLLLGAIGGGGVATVLLGFHYEGRAAEAIIDAARDTPAEAP